MKKKLLLSLLICKLAFCFSTSEEVFTKIYTDGVWKGLEGKSSSGLGSEYKNALLYMEFLQEFMLVNEIKSVLDFGCGDWSFSQHIDWSRVKYLGVDVVKHVIENNKQKFVSFNISFMCVDGLNNDLPSADLIICKDVLQHLPNNDILLFIKQLSKYKHCLITNDIDLDKPYNNNVDISLGDWRPLDLSKAPFNLRGEKKVFKIGGRNKEIFYIKNE